MKLKEKLIQYFDASYPILYINTYEEIKTDLIIKEAAGERTIWEWNESSKLCNFENKQTLSDYSLDEALNFFITDKESTDKKILVFKDTAAYLIDHSIVSKIKELSLRIECGWLDVCIIIVSSVLTIPKEIENFITILEPDILEEKEIKALASDFIHRTGLNATDVLLEKMSVAFKGLTEFEIEALLASAVARDGDITLQSLDLIFEQKKQMIMKAGILEMIEVKESSEDIGGLENIKEWLNKKSKVYKDINRAAEFGVDMPKGVLIAGVPGCGKSLTAKVTSAMFEVPLMKLDMGRILGKYVGESEENMRRSINLAEAISPCILWIDELEKAFSGFQGGTGNDVMMRLFAAFLTWMQEKTAPVFVVATANNIAGLPPEFKRKGRFDDIFYVGLPKDEERKKIFEIHIKKRRKKDLQNIDIDKLVKLTDGYSGADIEGIVRDAIEDAFCSGANTIKTSHFENAIKETESLSKLMKDELKKMSEYYEKNHFKNASK